MLALQSLQGLKEGEALIASNERTIMDEPTGPSINPIHPPSFIPFTELDAVSGAKLEMEQDHETPEQVLSLCRCEPACTGQAAAAS